jgi:hypothetical protein
MTSVLKWTGISIGIAAGLAVAAAWARRLNAKVDQGLAHMERITTKARQAAEKTADALASTEDAVHAARRTMS